MSDLKREIYLCLSILAVLIMSSLSGCIADTQTKSTLHGVLSGVSVAQAQICAGELDVLSPEWARCKDLEAAIAASSIAVDLDKDEDTLASVAHVLEGLKATWHVRCDSVPSGSKDVAVCSAVKTVTDVLIQVYSTVNATAS